MESRVKSLTLLATALFLIYLLLTGKILLLIAARFLWLIWLAAAGLVVTALSYRTLDGEGPHGCRLTWSRLALVLAPLALGILTPAAPLGSGALANREIGTVFNTAPPLGSRSVRQATERRETTILDWAIAFAEAQDPASFEGETADITGFAYQPDYLPQGMWTVNRFVITCCVADAMPVGLVVRTDDKAPPPNDQWVRVEGHFTTAVINGERVSVLVAETVTLVDLPRQPYIY